MLASLHTRKLGLVNRGRKSKRGEKGDHYFCPHWESFSEAWLAVMRVSNRSVNAFFSVASSADILRISGVFICPFRCLSCIFVRRQFIEPIGAVPYLSSIFWSRIRSHLETLWPFSGSREGRKVNQWMSPFSSPFKPNIIDWTLCGALYKNWSEWIVQRRVGKLQV